MENSKENLVYSLVAQEYNLKLADALKKIPEFIKPDWVSFVKSCPGKERPIEDEDFWHKRSASILRQIYKKEAVGVNRLKTRYGCKKKKGVKKEKFKKSGGKIIRTILQQSDSCGFTEITKPIKGVRGKKIGRKLTERGKKFLETLE